MMTPRMRTPSRAKALTRHPPARGRTLLAVLGALSFSQGAPGQDFEVAYARAEELRTGDGAEPRVLRAAYAEALAAFDHLAATEPSRVAQLARAAHSALLAGEPARALALVGDAERRDAGDGLTAEGRGLLAEVRLRGLVESQQVDAFIGVLRATAAAHPQAAARAVAAVVAGHGGAVCEAADRALRRGQPDDGLFVFETLATATGRDPIALGNWALSLRHVGRVEASEQLYREALAASPDDAGLWNDYGLLLKGQRRDREAMAAFAKSLALDSAASPGGPSTGPAVSNLALMQARGRGVDVGAAALPDPPRALAAVVARRLDAMMARRLLLDSLAAMARFRARQPDREGAGR